MRTQQIFSANETKVMDLQHQGVISIAQLKHMPLDSLEFISIHSAFKQKKIKIEEVSESGNVNELLVTNLSNEYIFIMDGDILRGAKQNRVANTSVYMGAKKKYLIPVSCVEQGRWRYDSNDFLPSDELVSKKIRLDKNRDIFMKKKTEIHKHSPSQERVWQNVSFSLMETETPSSTQSYSDIHIAKRKSFTAMTDKLKINNEANGLAYFIQGKLNGIEIFNRKDVYQDYFEKLLQTIAMDSNIKMKKSFMSQDWRLSKQDAKSLISNSISNFNHHQDNLDVCNGVCLGKEYRLQSKKQMFYNLSYNDQTIHQSIIVFEQAKDYRWRSNPNSSFEDIINEEDNQSAKTDKKESLIQKIWSYIRSNTKG